MAPAAQEFRRPDDRDGDRRVPYGDEIRPGDRDRHDTRRPDRHDHRENDRWYDQQDRDAGWHDNGDQHEAPTGWHEIQGRQETRTTGWPENRDPHEAPAGWRGNQDQPDDRHRREGTNRRPDPGRPAQSFEPREPLRSTNRSWADAENAENHRTGGGRDHSPSAAPPQWGSLIPYVAFVLAVAIVSVAAGYTLNRLVGPARHARSAHPTTAGTGTGTPTGPGGSGPSTAGGGLAGLSAEQVAIRLAGAGLPLRTTVVYTASTDPDRLLGTPGGYTSRIAFSDPRVGHNEVAGSAPGAIERGGAVEVFPDAASARQRAQRILTVTTDNPLVTEYVYVATTVVLRISLVLPEVTAQQYETTLRRLAA